MTRTRNMADLLDSSGDIKSGRFDNLTTDVVGDTTPQLGGDLDANGNNITLGDSSGTDNNRIVLGAGGDLDIFHDGSASNIRDSGTGPLSIRGSAVRIKNVGSTQDMATFTSNGAVVLFYQNSEKIRTRNAGVTVSGDIQVDSTSDDATVGPTINLSRQSASPATNDILGQVKFNGKNDADEDTTYARIYTSIQDETDGTEDSRLEFKGLTGGAETTYLQMKQGINTFYRDVELSTNRNLIFEGSASDNFETTVTVTNPTDDRTITLPDATGTVLLTDGDGSNLTGINTDLVGDTTPQLGGNLDTNGNAILFGSSKWSIELDTGDNDLLFKYNGTTVFKLASNGAVTSADDVTAFGTP